MRRSVPPARKTTGKKAPGPPPLRGRRLAVRILLLLLLALSPLVAIVASFALYVQAGVSAGASEPSGTLTGFGLLAPVHVARDARGIPHVRAQNERDLYFAEGYLQGTDRLFQLDIYKRSSPAASAKSSERRPSTTTSRPVPTTCAASSTRGARALCERAVDLEAFATASTRR